MQSADLEGQKNKSNIEDKWMIRPCPTYEEEYKDCTSIRERFHQYFIHGETLDCNHWKIDFNNCKKWTANSDEDAAIQIIESEKERRKSRLKAHYGNNTWKRRSEPPGDWNKPLPDWMVKEHESSYLDHKAKEISEGNNSSDFSKRTLCIIM